MKSPNSIVQGPSGAFFVADLRSPILFRVSIQGKVTKFAKLPGIACGHLALADGALYATGFAEHGIVRVESGASFSVVAGTGARGFEDGANGAANVSYPNGIGTASDAAH